MTNLIVDAEQVLGEPIEDGVVRISSSDIQYSYGKMILPEYEDQELVDGRTVFENVSPGRTIIQFHWGLNRTATVRANIPRTDEITLADLVLQRYNAEPAVVGQVAQSVIDAETVLGTVRNIESSLEETAEGVTSDKGVTGENREAAKQSAAAAKESEGKAAESASNSEESATASEKAKDAAQEHAGNAAIDLEAVTNHRGHVDSQVAHVDSQRSHIDEQAEEVDADRIASQEAADRVGTAEQVGQWASDAEEALGTVQGIETQVEKLNTEVEQDKQAVEGFRKEAKDSASAAAESAGDSETWAEISQDAGEWSGEYSAVASTAAQRAVDRMQGGGGGGITDASELTGRASSELILDDAVLTPEGMRLDELVSGTLPMLPDAVVDLIMEIQPNMSISDFVAVVFGQMVRMEEIAMGTGPDDTGRRMIPEGDLPDGVTGTVTLRRVSNTVEMYADVQLLDWTNKDAFYTLPAGFRMPDNRHMPAGYANSPNVLIYEDGRVTVYTTGAGRYRYLWTWFTEDRFPYTYEYPGEPA